MPSSKKKKKRRRVTTCESHQHFSCMQATWQNFRLKMSTFHPLPSQNLYNNPSLRTLLLRDCDFEWLVKIITVSFLPSFFSILQMDFIIILVFVIIFLCFYFVLFIINMCFFFIIYN